MCNTDPSSASALVAFTGMKPALNNENPSPVNSVAALGNFMSSAVFSDYQRFQLYDYAQAAANRLRLAHPALVSSPYGSLGPYMSPVVDGQTGLPYGVSPFVRFDPRSRFVQEEPKPQHSYIGLIAMAILSCPDKKMVLSDIYQYILDNYPYFRNRGPGWRNSIRHNLSLNDCFIKAGRSANGKGHYWAIHPANIEDFKKGDFRRRKAQRKVRKHMGLSVPDDDDSPTPTPPPQLTPDLPFGHPHPLLEDPRHHLGHLHNPLHHHHHHHHLHSPIQVTVPKRRMFDVESLLAPDIPVSPARSRPDLRPESSEGHPLHSPGHSPSIISHLRSNICGAPRPRLDMEDSDPEIDVTEVNQEVEERSSRPEIALNALTGQWALPSSTSVLNPVGVKPQVSTGKVNPICSPINLTVSWPNSAALLNYGAFIRGQSNANPADLSHAINPLLRRWQLRKPAEDNISGGKAQE